jgi:hypothetical protein
LPPDTLSLGRSAQPPLQPLAHCPLPAARPKPRPSDAAPVASVNASATSAVAPSLPIRLRNWASDPFMYRRLKSPPIACAVRFGCRIVSTVAAGIPNGNFASPSAVFGIAPGCSARAAGVWTISRFNTFPAGVPDVPGDVAATTCGPAVSAAPRLKCNRLSIGPGNDPWKNLWWDSTSRAWIDWPSRPTALPPCRACFSRCRRRSCFCLCLTVAGVTARCEWRGT